MPKDVTPDHEETRDAAANGRAKPEGAVSFRKPEAGDGSAIWDLIRACKPLDENSLYCNLLQCDHFRDTCVIAELDGRIVGWISGYLPPAADDTLFVWQVAVSEAARGHGLGGRMLKQILSRPECAGVTRMQTTITADNAASWALFTRFSERMGATLDSAPHFIRTEHFRGQSATEHMVTIQLAEPLRSVA